MSLANAQGLGEVSGEVSGDGSLLLLRRAWRVAALSAGLSAFLSGGTKGAACGVTAAGGADDGGG